MEVIIIYKSFKGIKYITFRGKPNKNNTGTQYVSDPVKVKAERISGIQ